MVAISMRHESITALFKALDIDHSNVFSFDMSIKMDEPVSVKVQYFVENENMEKVPGVMKDFYLAEKL